jgi:hypothetical protein
VGVAYFKAYSIAITHQHQTNHCILTKSKPIGCGIIKKFISFKINDSVRDSGC